MKARLYDENIKPKGSVDIFADNSIRIQFSKNNTELMIKFRNCVNTFLKEEKLKIVSNEASARKHHNHKEYTKKIYCLDVFYKYLNIKTRRIELKPICELNNYGAKND